MYIKNYKIQDDGIWIPKSELEKWYDHYTKVSLEYFKEQMPIAMFYTGKADVFCDLIRAIDDEKEKEE